MSIAQVHYRPLFGRVLAVVTVVVCAFGIVALFWGEPEAALRYAWPIALVAVLAWAVFWRPGLTVEEHGITVENVLRTYFVPWPEITDVDTRLALTLVTAKRRIQVWAAPAPGRHRVMGLSSRDFEGVSPGARGEFDGLRPSDAITTPTGNLAQLIRGHWERLRDSGMLAPGVDPEASHTTWHRTTIAVVAVLAVATTVGLLV